jgi:hypothetical protein
MTVEELIELFDEFANMPYDETCFEKIENPMHCCPDVCAFLMLQAIAGGTDNMVSGAEHDEIYLSVDLDDVLDSCPTKEWLKDLYRCGVMVNYNGFSMYV